MQTDESDFQLRVTWSILSSAHGRDGHSRSQTSQVKYLRLKKVSIASRPLFFFFRPTPLGFRQVVQHVQLHVA